MSGQFLYPLLFRERELEIPVFLVPDQFDRAPVARILGALAFVVRLDAFLDVRRVARVISAVAASDDVYVESPGTFNLQALSPRILPARIL